MPVVLGISAHFHDAAAALVSDGKVLAAVQEERFSRLKNDASFPRQSIAWCLEDAGLQPANLDAIVFYEKPWLRFERILETFVRHAPHGLNAFLHAMPGWLNQKLFLKRAIRREMAAFGTNGTGGKVIPAKTPVLFSQHHQAHAASAFFPSPFAEAAVLTIDGVGEWATASIAAGRGNELTTIAEMPYPHSLGLLYSAMTHFLGFRINDGEYKVMGLAAYGEPKSVQTQSFYRTIREELLTLHADGSMHLNQQHFRFGYTLRMLDDQHWGRLFGLTRREPEQALDQGHANLAWALQNVAEEAVLRMARHAKEKTGLRHLCLAGGVALNSVANGKLQRSGMFDAIWVQPAAGDAGGALGAALDASHCYFGTPRILERHVGLHDGMHGAFLGPCFDGQSAANALCKQFNTTCQSFASQADLAAFAAEALAEGAIIGWFSGRMEFGPRALGARSILADPTQPNMQEQLNGRIKKRESFRPFAPVMLAQEARTFFDADYPSPYMQLVAPLAEQHRLGKPDPEDQSFQNATADERPGELVAFPDAKQKSPGLAERLRKPRSNFQAVVHVDYSARLQVVDRSDHPLWLLLHAFRERTGTAILVNTSFNVKDQPIVCTPEDAYRCFLETQMDYLILEGHVFRQSNSNA